ncbi:MAG TPA: LemA family protein [Candidatus Saccharimonadales bacterium]|nr:LemA family protein [Candidatus Saccharimonadales bacterium]
MTLLYIIIGLVVLIGIIMAVLYNRLVRLNQQSSEAWSDITVQLKRRADLIPNLVNTVKGYAAHESGVFEKVTEARAATLSAQTPGEAAKAEGDFQSTMKSLFAVAENYPDLKASQNFQQLQAELTDTEDKIQASRRFYNSVVRDFNSARQTFPSNIFANMLGFKQNKEFFELSDADAAAAAEPVNVQF